MVHRAGHGRPDLLGGPTAGLGVPLKAVRVYLVRHGRAAGGWDDDPDPGLDDVGRAQAAAMAVRLAGVVPAGTPVLSSPLRRCRETAAVLGDRWSVDVGVEPLVAEIPSPEGVPIGERVTWLRQAMTGRWADLGPRYVAYRDAVVARVAAFAEPTVVVSHFVAINAVIGATLGDDRLLVRSLDNCSVTVVETGDAGLELVEAGREADTLIR